MTEKAARVLVTGGAGFIGSWLCERLSREGYAVTCLDNLATGRRNNLDGLDVTFINADVTVPLNLKVDYIFDMASRASPKDFVTHPIEILMTNSMGTHNILNLAAGNKARVLFASTSEVYGDPLQHPQKEDYFGNVNPRGLRACYDESKRFSEALCMAFHRTRGVDVRLARIFNTYGERMRPDDGRVIPNLVNQAISGEPMTVYGDGSQTRSFCYAADLVEGLLKLMFHDGAAGQVVNLGNPHEVPVLDIANTIKHMTKSKSQIEFRPLPEGDPVRRRPDIAKAKELLDWAPSTALPEGLSRTIAYFRKEAGL